MARAPEIDVRDLTSVREAEVLLGDDWVAPNSTVDQEMRRDREGRRWFSINKSPIARKIVVFNLIALMILVIGVLFLNPSRDSLATQRSNSLISEVHLIANVIEAEMPVTSPVNFQTGDGIDIEETVRQIDLREGVEILVFDTAGAVVATAMGKKENSPPTGDSDFGSTMFTDLLNSVWTSISDLVGRGEDTNVTQTPVERVFPLLQPALSGQTMTNDTLDENGLTVSSVAAPVQQNGRTVGVVAINSATGEIDLLLRQEREQVLQMFLIALLVSIGLSLVLASTIANPLADLARAAELGRAKNARRMQPGRIRIPDLTARPDEIGRLSGALRGMVSALYDRIDGNEQFAADVAHEIKNPLASLRSAVGTLRVANRPDQRDKLLDVIDHDVRRLDRLVSDISNASRLDSELVKEEEESFDLINLLKNLTEYLGQNAEENQIEFIHDLPQGPLVIDGLEARLAQVFVNLITNAISFCGEGDAIRVWAREKENRVLIVVEDTGPGIPEGALTKIFKRFYSERPEGQFGNNSGLGLAISKQIVEAHGGVIWAENIRNASQDVSDTPLGARFVVGLPV